MKPEFDNLIPGLAETIKDLDPLKEK